MSDMSNAFGISKDDVENVLNAARRWEKTILPARASLAEGVRLIPIAGMAIPNLSLSELSSELFGRLDHNAIAAAALNGGEEMDDQTDAAYLEIERQLNEMDPRILTQGYLPPEAESDTSRSLQPLSEIATAEKNSRGNPGHAVDHNLQVMRFTSKVVDRLSKEDLVAALFFCLNHPRIARASLDAGPDQDRQEAAALGEIWSQMGPVAQPRPVDFEQLDKHHRASVSDAEVEAGLLSEVQVQRFLSGAHPIAAGFDDTPFVGCPDSFGEKNFANIVWHEDRGDPSVGIQGRSGWTLGPDQSGTVVADLAAHDKRGEALQEAIVALQSEMDSAGILTSDATGVVKKLYEVRVAAARASGASDAKASIAFWEGELASLTHPDDSSEALRKDSPKA